MATHDRCGDDAERRSARTPASRGEARSIETYNRLLDAAEDILLTASFDDTPISY